MSKAACFVKKGVVFCQERRQVIIFRQNEIYSLTPTPLMKIAIIARAMQVRERIRIVHKKLRYCSSPRFNEYREKMKLSLPLEGVLNISYPMSGVANISINK